VAKHSQLTVEAGCPVHFCAPRSRGQRGTNENTNRLLRQYLGEGADVNASTQTDLSALAARVKDRARKVLGRWAPAEVYRESIETTRRLLLV
jgi:IS30 family transposase